MIGPSANEVRREAFQAAAAAVDRFLERVGDPVPEELNQSGVAAWARFRSEMARVVDLNLEMVRDAFGLYVDLLSPESLQPDRAAGRLVLGPGIPGSEAAAVLWLHNFDDDPIASVELIGSGLTSGSGDPIDDPGWSFIPSTPSVPARSAVPVLAKVVIPPDAQGGPYEGTISTNGRRGEPIKVRVEVTAVEPVRHDSW